MGEEEEEHSASTLILELEERGETAGVQRRWGSLRFPFTTPTPRVPPANEWLGMSAFSSFVTEA